MYYQYMPEELGGEMYFYNVDALSTQDLEHIWKVVIEWYNNVLSDHWSEYGFMFGTFL